MFRLLAASILLALTTTANAATYRAFAYNAGLEEVISDTGMISTTDSCPAVLNYLDNRVADMAESYEMRKGAAEYVTVTDNGFIVFGIPVQGPRTVVVYYLECREDAAL